jgi:hypothetical protein
MTKEMKWNLSILEYPVGWPVLFMQVAQDFMIGWEQWACFTRWATECSKPSQQHTTQQITPRPLAFTQALTTLTKPPAFFTPRAVPQCTTVQAQWQAEAGLCSCCPCPMRPCHWPAGFPAACPLSGTGTGTSHTASHAWTKAKEFCLHAPATDMIQCWYSECMATCHSTQISAPGVLSTFLLFCLGKQYRGTPIPKRIWDGRKKLGGVLQIHAY